MKVDVPDDNGRQKAMEVAASISGTKDSLSTLLFSLKAASSFLALGIQLNVKKTFLNLGEFYLWESTSSLFSDVVIFLSLSR